MKRACDWQGLIFPDVYVTKFFFKNNLNSRPGNLLDLGCGSGNNARLFTEYGWSVTGIDLSAESLADARSNWENEPPESWNFIEKDLRQGLPALHGPFDALLGNLSLLYFERRFLEGLLTETSEYLAPGAYVNFKFRTPEDWRYGKGVEIEKNTFQLDVWETGEEGLTMAFYEPDDLCTLIDHTLGPLHDRVVLLESHENIQNGLHIDNRDVIVWGRI